MLAPKPADLSSASLSDLVVRLFAGYERPDHLKRIVDLLELCLTQEVKAVFATPPQHSKTTILLVTLIKFLAMYQKTQPAMHAAYISYNDARGRDQSSHCRRLAGIVGLETEGTLNKWGIPLGPDIIWGGIGTGITGSPINKILIVDDPIKDQIEAESLTYRERVWSWWESVARTRCHPGTSKIVVATRWHEDDLSGRLIKQGWDYINLPAIADDTDDNRIPGTALWPSQRPLEWLEAERDGGDDADGIDPYTWESMWQGNPMPRGGAVFIDPHYYGGKGDPQLPDLDNLAICYGIDLAYTSSTKGDWSVIVTLGHDGDFYYVLDVTRRRCEAPAFARLIQAKVALRPGPVIWVTSGPEKGVVQLVNDHLKHGVKIRHIATNVNKLTRAIPCQGAWSNGKILVSRTAKWRTVALSEICSFQGDDNDTNDDIVDALVAAFTGLQRRRSRSYLAKRHRRGAAPTFRV